MKPAILWKGMRLIVMPVYRLTASSMISSFRVSGKRHLLLTGGRGTGKTTLLRALVPLLCPGAQEITTAVYLRTVWKFEKVWAEK